MPGKVLGFGIILSWCTIPYVYHRGSILIYNNIRVHAFNYPTKFQGEKKIPLKDATRKLTKNERTKIKINDHFAEDS